MIEREEQARQLTEEERPRLADTLLDSLRGPALAEIEAAWAVELEARVAAFKSGEVETYPANLVFAECSTEPSPRA
ncbi:MAG TPA: addiction module protein [Thermoanaerobaculia bacterium]|nr:addiction module protein [Thermoanaerobaculia bacterium]